MWSANARDGGPVDLAAFSFSPFFFLPLAPACVVRAIITHYREERSIARANAIPQTLDRASGRRRDASKFRNN
jgi:hypothetical protein